MSEKKILIVDDDWHLVVGLTARLKAHGYSVISAQDAITAIAMVRTDAPHLAILDLGLPAGDGFFVLETIRSNEKSAAMPVIVLSARDPAHNKKRALEAGAVAFFQKPPDNHLFLAAIRQTLGETVGMSRFLQT